MTVKTKNELIADLSKAAARVKQVNEAAKQEQRALNDGDPQTIRPGEGPLIRNQNIVGKQ